MKFLRLMKIVVDVYNSGGIFRRKILAENSGGNFGRKILAENSCGKFRWKILAENSGEKFWRKIHAENLGGYTDFMHLAEIQVYYRTMADVEISAPR
jgi:hypothetical protein